MKEIVETRSRGEGMGRRLFRDVTISTRKVECSAGTKNTLALIGSLYCRVFYALFGKSKSSVVNIMYIIKKKDNYEKYMCI